MVDDEQSINFSALEMRLVEKGIDPRRASIIGNTHILYHAELMNKSMMDEPISEFGGVYERGHDATTIYRIHRDLANKKLENAKLEKMSAKEEKIFLTGAI